MYRYERKQFRRIDIPTEFHQQSHTFVPLRERRAFLEQRQIRRSQKNPTLFYAAITFFLVLINLFFYTKIFTFQKSETNEVLSATTKNSPVSTETNEVTYSQQIITLNPPSGQKYKSLEVAVNAALDGSKGDYAFVIKHLQTGESYTKQPDKVYEPGSLYKLWVMAAVFDQIEKGSLKEDQELSRSISFLNQSFGIPPENAEQTSGLISLTVSQALNQMITISHNYAAMLLTEKIKLSTVKAFLADEGFMQSKVGTKTDTPKTTANDIAKFYERVYKADLVNQEASGQMLELLKKQQKRNKLPLYLPENVELAHKTGELGMVSHDAGIVFTPKGDYIIVAMSETSSPKGAEDRIGKVSEAVYEYFINK